jgi:superfamily I DNA/RNA helicase
MWTWSLPAPDGPWRTATHGSITFFGDVAQQIYGRRLTWSDAGLDVDPADVWRFEHNYRNSPQIAALGLAIAAMPYFADEPDMVRPTGFAAEGPPPTLVRFSSAAEEFAFVVDQARRAGQTGSVAILLRRRTAVAAYRNRLRGAQHLHRDMGAWRPGAGISLGTVHAAKGLEFDTVIVPDMTAETWPEPEAVQSEGLEEATAGDGRLLYVAVTRARQNLIFTAAGPLTELLPANTGLWQEQQR